MLGMGSGRDGRSSGRRSSVAPEPSAVSNSPHRVHCPRRAPPPRCTLLSLCATVWVGWLQVSKEEVEGVMFVGFTDGLVTVMEGDDAVAVLRVARHGCLDGRLLV